jgi:hypothetical protein
MYCDARFRGIDDSIFAAGTSRARLGSIAARSETSRPSVSADGPCCSYRGGRHRTEASIHRLFGGARGVHVLEHSVRDLPLTAMDGHGETVCGCMPPGHRRLDSTAVLGAVDALRVTSARPSARSSAASTPRSAGPSGIDGASAQRERWRLRDGRLIAAADTHLTVKDAHSRLAGHRCSRRPTPLNAADLHAQDPRTWRGQESLSPWRLL